MFKVLQTIHPRTWFITVILTLSATIAWAASAGRELLDALQAGDTKLTKTLLTKGAPVNSVDELGTSALMYAALYADAGLMRLLLDRGADPNHADESGATALMWAASDSVKVRLLIERGADVNVTTKVGRTPLLIAAGMPGSDSAVRLLLTHGADANVIDKVSQLDHWNKTPMLAAAGSGDPAIVKLLLDHGVNPNQRAGFLTPMALAAVTASRHNAELLLARGAEVKNSPDLAVNDVTMFRRLLEKGANPRIRAVAGMDAMMLLAASEDSDPEVARDLLKLGLDPTAGLSNLHTEHGYGSRPETPLEWASRHGDTRVARILAAATKGPIDLPVPEVSNQQQRLKAGTPRAAIEKALPLLHDGGREFFKRSGCVSCHHNMLPAVAFSLARARGIGVDDERVRRNSEQSVAYLKGNQETLFQGVQLTGTDSTVAYLLWGLSADGYPRDRATDAAAYYLAQCQRPEGRWRVIPGRPPIESIVSATALGIRALQSYLIPGRAAEFRSRIRRASKWLAVYAPRTGEERSMRVLGLAWAGTEPQSLRTAAEELAARQRADGGWPQLDTLASDAYATGQALYALDTAGRLSKQTLERGVRFLLDTQLADGSWRVRSRSYPVQANYFDTGFPHGRDQWISAAATSWACIGLSLAMKP
jgi:ankyrin repeat protein